MRKKISIIGEKYGLLTVIKEVEEINHKRTLECICECGNTKIVAMNSLRTGRTKSCGCLHKKTLITHNLSKTRIYRVYMNIKARCYNKNRNSYKNYGALGVTMCSEWKEDFNKFYDWCIKNNLNEKNRIDKDIKCIELGIVPHIYSPKTCTVVDVKTNNNNSKKNKKLEYNGEILNLCQWAEKLNINPRTLSKRLSRGWSIPQSLEFEKRVVNRKK